MNWWREVIGDTVRSTDNLMPCPVCKGDKPKAVGNELYSYLRRGSRIIEVLDGKKVRCEECGAIFAIWYSGRQTFIPKTITTPVAPVDPAKVLDPRPPLPIPKARPRAV